MLVDIAKILGVEGLPSTIYFCDNSCAQVAHGSRIGRPKGQRLQQRLDKFSSGLRGTDLRVGDEVFVLEDMSPGRNVIAGDAVVTALEYDARERDTIITCQYIVGGRARTYHAGVTRRTATLDTHTRRKRPAPAADAPAARANADAEQRRVDALLVHNDLLQRKARKVDTLQRGLADESERRVAAEAAAAEATAALPRADRRAERAERALSAVEEHARAQAETLDELDADCSKLKKLESQLERERDALVRRVTKLQATSNPTELRRLQEQVRSTALSVALSVAGDSPRALSVFLVLRVCRRPRMVPRAHTQPCVVFLNFWFSPTQTMGVSPSSSH